MRKCLKEALHACKVTCRYYQTQKEYEWIITVAVRLFSFT